jgi:TPR repeat protein
VKNRFIILVVVLWLVGCAPQHGTIGHDTASSTSYARCSSGLECQNIGLNFVSRGENPSYKIARGYFYKACNYGESEGCNNLAFLYANGRGGEQSYTLAYKYWGMACRMGNELGCTNLELAKEKVANMKK